jgi:membrane protease YdiL (CAAX protease family)
VSTPARKHNSLGIFFTVTFATSWACWLIAIAMGGSPMKSPAAIPYLLGAFGPTIGAIVIRLRREPTPAHTVRLRFNARLLWVPVFLAVASATVVAAVLVANLPGGVNMSAGQHLIQTAGGLAPFIVAMLIGGPLSEEPGWRGTAYPRLRASLGRVQAGLLLGVVWAAWHLPLFFIPGTVQHTFGLASANGVLFLVSIIPATFLTGFAYERAGVLGSIAVHFGINTTVALLAVDKPEILALIIGIQVVVVAIPLALQRERRADVQARRTLAAG